MCYINKIVLYLVLSRAVYQHENIMHDVELCHNCVYLNSVNKTFFSKVVHLAKQNTIVVIMITGCITSQIVE